MERQAGLGRSLEDVLDAVPPIQPLDPEPSHALFGIAPDDAPVADATSEALADSKKKKKKKKKSDGDKKKKSKKKAKGRKKA